MDERKDNLKNAESDMIIELNELKAHITRLKKELEDKEWASRKTNEGIKILYKELERKNEELKKLDQLKSDFISNVSHELRTPLTTIREAVSQVLEGILGQTTPEQREFLSMCLEDIDRLKRIINNLLDISKIEAGKVHAKRELADIIELARKVCSVFLPRFNALGLEIKSVFSRESIEIYADRDKIIQVFNNLIGNAIKFTERGHVEISVQDKGSYVECYVADTGRGMRDEDLVKVFDKFQQFGREAGPGEKGTGLGLAISKGIVELHRGQIWVESKLNKGTKFTFTLPKCTPKELFRQYLVDCFKESFRQDTLLSALNVYIKNFDVIDGSVLDKVLKAFESLSKNNLRGREDYVIKDNNAVLIILAQTAKKDAVSVFERLQKAFNDFLTRQHLSEEISLGFKIVGCPEDANTDEELFNKIINQ